MEKLRQEVEENLEAYQYERAQRFGVSQRAIGYALKRLGLSRKKTFSHPKAEPLVRNAYQKKITRYQKAHQRIVYLDGSGFAHDSSTKKLFG